MREGCRGQKKVDFFKVPILESEISILLAI
jgi:hypothetical protein